ncbi:MAG TPA: DNA sulfur modification protein DndB [Archangium sp.]|nr:DNA sulfur modification protein DndB [Archangium sp.]
MRTRTRTPITENQASPKAASFKSTTNKTPMPLANIEVRARDEEPGLGYVSQARFSHQVLYQFMQNSFVRYSPRYQRGFQPSLADEPDQKGWFDQLLPVSDHRLLIDQKRCNEMAIRWLRQDMTNRSLFWNARTDNRIAPPQYRESDHVLTVFSPLTIPDSGHRHRAIYTLVEWSLDAAQIPDAVKVDNSLVKKDEILKLLESYNPAATFATVTVLEGPAKTEGIIFYQANNLTKPAGPSVGYDLNPDQTPESRFIAALSKKSPIFAEEEIERRFTKIGEKSRKITTLSTLVEAVKVMNKRLQHLEQYDSAKYDDLLSFMTEFFEEYSNSFPAWKKTASMKERQEMRDSSLAMTNVMVHALFRLAFRVYEDMEASTQEWKTHKAWRTAVGKLAQKVQVKNEKGKPVSLPALHKDNPAWRGKVLIQGKDRQTGGESWSISNTRQTRQAAYEYLCELAGLEG